MHRFPSKNDCHLFDGLDERYHHAKFREDRTTRAGCKCENMVFVLFVTLRVGRAVRSSGIYFEQLLCRCLWFDFHSVFTFFRSDCPFKTARQFLFLFPSLGRAKFSRNCGQNFFAKSPKIGGKVCAHHFV